MIRGGRRGTGGVPVAYVDMLMLGVGRGWWGRYDIEERGGAFHWIHDCIMHMTPSHPSQRGLVKSV